MIHEVAAQLRALWRGLRHRCVRCGRGLGSGSRRWCSDECEDYWVQDSL